MDPVALVSTEWLEIDNLLEGLWYTAVFVVLCAFSMLMGHVAIPSLVASHHVPAITQKARPVCYIAAIVFLVIASYEFARVIDHSDVIAKFWDDYWI